MYLLLYERCRTFDKASLSNLFKVSFLHTCVRRRRPNEGNPTSERKTPAHCKIKDLMVVTNLDDGNWLFILCTISVIFWHNMMGCDIKWVNLFVPFGLVMVWLANSFYLLCFQSMAWSSLTAAFHTHYATIMLVYIAMRFYLTHQSLTHPSWPG